MSTSIVESCLPSHDLADPAARHCGSRGCPARSLPELRRRSPSPGQELATIRKRVATKLGDDLVIGPVEPGGVGDVGAQPQLDHAPASPSPGQVADQRVRLVGRHRSCRRPEPDRVLDPGPEPGGDLGLVVPIGWSEVLEVLGEGAGQERILVADPAVGAGADEVDRLGSRGAAAGTVAAKLTNAPDEHPLGVEAGQDRPGAVGRRHDQRLAPADLRGASPGELPRSKPSIGSPAARRPGAPTRRESRRGAAGPRRPRHRG